MRTGAGEPGGILLGWALGRSLAAQLTVAALEQTMAQRQPLSGLVHHSDRGVQYACREYVRLLESHGMLPSMLRPGEAVTLFLL